MLIVALIAFVMFTFIGDPVDQMVGLETTLEEREQLRERLGLKDPVPIQFLNFVAFACRVDFNDEYYLKLMPKPCLLINFVLW